MARITFTLTMKSLRLLTLLVAYSLSGCQHDPWSFQYTRTKPTQSIAGTYKPTSGTYTFLESMYKNTKFSQLELRKDGSFLIQNIASVWSPFPTGGGFESVNGKWSLVKHQDWWAVQMNVTSVTEADGHLNQQGFGTQAMLIGQEAPYTLHFGIGDPDSGDALQYELQ